MARVGRQIQILGLDKARGVESKTCYFFVLEGHVTKFLTVYTFLYS